MFIDIYQTDTEQLLNEIRHNLYEPVATMRATAEAALADPGLEAQVRRRLEQIAGQAEWLADMIHDCMGTERERGGEGTSNPAANLLQVINEAVAACRLTWPGDVSVTSPPGPVPCALHPVVLRRVISNVLSNAARAAGPSGVVTIEVNRGHEMSVVTVDDSGPGFGMIPSRYGIGLAEAARNITARGGKLDCSRSAHGGARVTLWLP